MLKLLNVLQSHINRNFNLTGNKLWNWYPIFEFTDEKNRSRFNVHPFDNNQTWITHEIGNPFFYIYFANVTADFRNYASSA